MSNKRVPIGNRPVTDPTAQTWVRQGDGAANVTTTSRADLYTARLTIDVTPVLRGRIKVAWTASSRMSGVTTIILAGLSGMIVVG